jgi:hypothetical protein
MSYARDKRRKNIRRGYCDCGNACGYQEPYGFVPEADCPIHDTPRYIPISRLINRLKIEGEI